MNKIYKSKIGWELIVILGVTFGTIAIVMACSGDYVPLFLNVILFLAIGYVLWKTEYTISKTNLNVKSSFLVNEDIAILSIRRIEETYNPISAPAASIDRLEIFYNKFDSILISPKDKKGFIADLLRINPNIDVKYRN